MAKIEITLDKAERHMRFNYSTVSMIDTFHDWMVELRPIQDRELSVVEIVYARNAEEAVYEAFWTRNMPADWIATEVERG